MTLEIDDHDPCSQLSELMQRSEPELSVRDRTVVVKMRTSADADDLGRLLEVLALEPSGVVARAAEAAYLAAECYDCVPWASAGVDTRRFWVRAACAALALVREP